MSYNLILTTKKKEEGSPFCSLLFHSITFLCRLKAEGPERFTCTSFTSDLNELLVERNEKKETPLELKHPVSTRKSPERNILRNYYYMARLHTHSSCSPQTSHPHLLHFECWKKSLVTSCSSVWMFPNRLTEENQGEGHQTAFREIFPSYVLTGR